MFAEEYFEVVSCYFPIDFSPVSFLSLHPKQFMQLRNVIQIKKKVLGNAERNERAQAILVKKLIDINVGYLTF